jgi:hypothetical protein
MNTLIAARKAVSPAPPGMSAQAIASAGDQSERDPISRRLGGPNVA